MAKGLSTSGAVGIVITGVPEVQGALSMLGTRGARAASTKALRAGINPVVAAVRRHTKTDVGKVTGVFRKSAGGRIGKRKKTGVYEARAGLNVGKKKTKLDSSGNRVPTGSYAPHAALIALGSKVRRTKSGANRGAMPATPVVPRAANESKVASLAAMKTNLLAGIEKETVRARVLTRAGQVASRIKRD